MSMKDPVHPGNIVRRECLEPLGLTVTAAAEALGVTRQALNNVVNAKASISPEMAVRLSKVFGSSPGTWLRMQTAYDLAHINERGIRVFPMADRVPVGHTGLAVMAKKRTVGSGRKGGAGNERKGGAGDERKGGVSRKLDALKPGKK